MALIRCQNGHMFSERRYGTICPYCNIDTAKKETKPEGFKEDLDIETNLLYQEVDPVCGWLVCIEGTRVGKDYKIKNGKNFIFCQQNFHTVKSTILSESLTQRLKGVEFHI